MAAEEKIEVEVRAVLSPKRAEETLKQAESLGAVLKWQGELSDEWLCRKESERLEDISIDKSGFALRLRRVADPYSNRDSWSIECKVLADGRDHALCREIEIPLANAEDAAKMRRLLHATGFKTFLEVRKKRKLYKLGDTLLVFEDIEGFGPVLEIESMQPKSETAKKKRELLELAAKLGVKESELQEKSATYLMMRKKFNA